MSSTERVFIGIDPGLDGAVCVLAGSEARFFDTPTAKGTTKRDYLIYEMADFLKPYAGAKAYLEAVSGRPGQGTASARSVGRGSGIWEGILAAHGIALEIVQPAVWKRSLGLLGADKDASRAKAQSLYPEALALLQRKKDADRAEALLLAEYGRRKAGKAGAG